MKKRAVMAGYRSLPGLLGLVIITALAGCDSKGAVEGITLSGTVEARETALAFQVTGRIERLLVDEGQKVTAGEVVALLVDDDYALALQKARAEVAAAEASLAVLEAGTRRQELKVAEAALDKARAERRYAEEEVRRLTTLLQKKLASQDQLDQAQLKYEITVTAVHQAQQSLQLLREGPRQEEIALD